MFRSKSKAFVDQTIIDKAHGLGDRMANSPVAACAKSLLMVGGNIDQLLSGEKALSHMSYSNRVADHVAMSVMLTVASMPGSSLLVVSLLKP